MNKSKFFRWLSKITEVEISCLKLYALAFGENIEQALRLERLLKACKGLSRRAIDNRFKSALNDDIALLIDGFKYFYDVLILFYEV